MRSIKIRSVSIVAGFLATAGLVAGTAITAAVAEEQASRISDTEYADMIQAYKAEHPNDFIGLDALVFERTGQHLTVQVDKSGPLSAAAAQQAWGEAQESQLVAPLDDYPSDAFTVALNIVPTGGSGIIYYGQWDWRDEFVGQGEPFDIANLQFDIPECVQLTDYDAGAGTWDGTETDKPTLRDSGVASGAPLWNVDARVSNFENSADNGYVTATADTTQCDAGPQIGAAFAYEGNIGGSLVSVSAGWGFLSISYSGGDLELQKSTEPVYVAYEFSGNVFGDFASCAAFGMSGADDGDWLDWQCRASGSLVHLWVADLT